MKLALLSHVLPGSGLGQATVIHRMFQGFDPERYCLISLRPEHPTQHGEAQAERLPAKQYELPRPFRLERGYSFGLARLRQLFNIRVAITQHARRLTSILRVERCDAIVACTGDVALLPAAYLASRRLRIPFYAYVFDHYSHREWQDLAARYWARRYEPILMRSASAVIVPNEMLGAELHQQYGIEPTVIHNSFDLSSYEADLQDSVHADKDEIRIVYTGEIYEAHYDSFRNLLKALQLLGRPEIKLHLYTSHPLKYLNLKGISGAIIRHPTRSPSEMPAIQRQADLLFLPLAFESPYPDLIRTSSTTKLGEYLAARRPILVHAPADSFVSWYARYHQCGLVADENDSTKLAEAIKRVLDDPKLANRMTANAWARARADFDINDSRSRFLKVVGREK